MKIITSQNPASPLFQSDLAAQIKIGGYYQHFKGGQYKIITLARSSSDLSWQVVYQTCYQNPVAQIWTRELGEFLSTVPVDGKQVQRFKLVSI